MGIRATTAVSSLFGERAAGHDGPTRQRNAKRWSDGDMRLRWTAAGMLEAERQFRRIIGYGDLARLAVAVEREVASAALPSPTPKEVPEPVTV